MKKYDKYKNSGVEWLGEIPEQWDFIRMKHLFKDHSEKNKPNEELLSVTQNKGVVPRTWVENRMVMPSGALESFKFIEKGDFAISLRSFEGGLEYCHHDGIISPAYTVLKTKRKINEKYYKYLFKSFSFISELQTSVVGIREGKNISFPELSYSFLPVPKVEEQTSIANFLDDKTAKIDQAITLKQKQIELLKERRQILIHKAVTRGLNNDVKLKDSSVEWIGEIPEHWKVKRFRNTFKLGKGLTITKENLTDEGIFCVNYGEIHSKFGFEVNPEIHKLKYVHTDYLINNSSSLINEGDFVFADTSEDLQGSGNFTYLNSKEQVFAGYHTVIARPSDNIISRFIAYEFDSLVFRSQIQAKVKGVKVYSITQSILKELSILVPPKNEQLEIVNYLDNSTKKIDTAISLKQQEIEKLKEYKMSLIDGVVTGKVKVY
ncbi:restriction endonuclease subunit S [Flavobacterium branchiicola]|uniref:Restriction endonuclease subunit S n=1 Tax=Flavobacterium branchiicola TaxID=1114875 RepID=A0ABV9PDK0_9FLAO|nr:restriction endonuclease subunit S [Flavobacterium branchiicola]MBS7254609.1 restriction endonuclease subunit S [Flavobacterium branchiicola]